MYEDDTEQLLRDGLGAVGGRVGPAHVRAGGRFGARLSARLLPIRRHEERIDLPALLPEPAAELAFDVLNHYGRALRSRADGLGGYEIRGMIGSGALDMNPAVVDVLIRPGGSLTVRAAAKEGLIPQRTAQKAVRRVIESLQSAAPLS